MTFKNVSEQDNAKLTEQHKKQGFPLADGAKLPKLDFAKYEIKRFHDSQGREVAVFDGLVNREDLDTLRLYLLQHNSAYRYQPYDDDAVEDHDNVSWIASLEVSLIMKSISFIFFIFWGERGWYKNIRYKLVYQIRFIFKKVDLKGCWPWYSKQ